MFELRERMRERCPVLPNTALLITRRRILNKLRELGYQQEIANPGLAHRSWAVFNSNNTVRQAKPLTERGELRNTRHEYAFNSLVIFCSVVQDPSGNDRPHE